MPADALHLARYDIAALMAGNWPDRAGLKARAVSDCHSGNPDRIACLGRVLVAHPGRCRGSPIALAENRRHRPRAHRVIDATPADAAILCLDMRGNIDAVEGNWSGSATESARATSAGGGGGLAVLRLRLCRLGLDASGPRQAGRRHRPVQARQPKRPALRRCAGRLGRGADGEEPVASGVGEIRGSWKKYMRPTGAGLHPEMGARPSPIPASPPKPRPSSPAPPRSISPHPRNPNWQG